MSAVAELAYDADRIAGLGDNGPPAATPFELVREHIEGLLTEAHNWADGTTVTSQAQADEASRLIDDLRKAAKAAEGTQDDEQKPHDDAVAEIRARYRPLIQSATTKNPGKVWKAIDALKACVKPFLDKLEAERLAAVEKAHQEAATAAQAAADAARAAAPADLAAQEAAEDLITAAQQAAANARRIENTRSQARGGERAMGLRKTYTATLTNPRDALLHYWGGATPGVGREALIACLQQLAQQDVNRKVHTIPGVTVVEGTTF